MPPPPAPQGGDAAPSPTPAVADAAPAHKALPLAAALADELPADGPPADELPADEQPTDGPPADELPADEPTESAAPLAPARGRRQRTPTTWSLPVPDSLATQAADTGTGTDTGIGTGNGNGADVARSRPAGSPSPSGQPAADQGSSMGPGLPADGRGAEPAMNGGDGVDDEEREAPSSGAPAAADADRSRSTLSDYQDGMQRARSQIKPSMLRDFLGVDGDKE